MPINQYLDSTYLKTAKQANNSKAVNDAIVEECIDEAIEYGFKAIIIRPKYIVVARKKIDQAKAKVLVGTVIDFPKGNSTIDKKLAKAVKAINSGADELDFVVNYQEFIQGNIELIKQEIIQCTNLCFAHSKTLKWIIEVAALSEHQIVHICAIIKNTVIAHFKEKDYDKVFVKSSTGFFQTSDGSQNGASIRKITLMLENAFPLPIKASGGIKNHEEAQNYIQMGVKRIGTSNAKAIVLQKNVISDY
jgi:deoxyribose-phosphate aldolase